MLIQLKNFGPISYFEFDTEKQMHFIFGENNIGKSYAISAVYLILKNIANPHIHVNSIEIKKTVSKFVEQITEKVKLGKKEEEVNITQETKEITAYMFSLRYLPLLQKSFQNSFNDLASLKNEFSQENGSITLKFASGNSYYILIQNNELVLKKLDLKIKVAVRSAKVNRYPQFLERNTSLIAYRNKEYKIHDARYIPTVLLEGDLDLWNKYYNKIYFLPASRSGLYNLLSAFGAIFAELSQNRTSIHSQFSIPSMSEQVSDYFLNISNIKKNKKEDIFSTSASLIEQNVLKGSVFFDDITKKLYYQPIKTNIHLDLSNTSSMISEIAPLVAYLKHVISYFNQEDDVYEYDEDEDETEALIKRNDSEELEKGANILFIEEPEAHLHPKIQVEIIKMLANLAKEGLKIVITSHSNYLFNKLSNMILAKEIDPSTIRVAHMKLGEMGSYVDENSMQVDQDGIDDDNFSETAEALYLERMKLYQQNH